MNTDKGTLETALAAGAAQARTLTPSTPTDVILVPPGYNAASAEDIVQKHLPFPRRTKATVALTTPDSFIRYVEMYRSADTKIFACIPQDSNPPKFEAIIDYHQDRITQAADKEAVTFRPEPQPRWCEHRAKYQAVYSEEWKRWMAKDRVRMDQEQFALLLEENQDLIINPAGADLLELVQNLEGKNDITCNSLIRLSNGKQKLIYEEQVVLKGATGTTIKPGEVEFPTELTAAIAIFDGSPVSYAIKCRLRYRIEQRKLVFWFEVVDKHLVVKDAVSKIVEQIQKSLGIEPLLGQP